MQILHGDVDDDDDDVNHLHGASPRENSARSNSNFRIAVVPELNGKAPVFVCLNLRKLCE